MFLRRIIEHVTTQNWTAIVLDFIIVVAGVFVGLQAQEWSVERQNQQRLERIVAALKADMADARRVESGLSFLTLTAIPNISTTRRAARCGRNTAACGSGCATLAH